MEPQNVRALEYLLASRAVSCVYFYLPTCPHCVKFAPKFRAAADKFDEDSYVQVNLSLDAFKRLPKSIPRITGVPCVMIYTQRGYEWKRVPGYDDEVMQNAHMMMQQERSVEAMPSPHSLMLVTPTEQSDDYARGFYKVANVLKERLPVNRVVDDGVKLAKVLVIKDGKIEEYDPSELPTIKTILDQLSW